MSRNGPDEERQTHVGDGTTRTWLTWRYGARYLFIGPRPGAFLFESVDANSWAEAIACARHRWNKVDEIRRDRWYGDTGRYTEQGGT
jgi:hypothetical protein